MPKERPQLLVVDDEPDTCANLADIFQDYGYDVSVAHNGRAALSIVEVLSFDLALSDLKMPGMNGLELYREIRRISAGTVAIIVTAYANRDTTAAAISAGAWHVLSKPVDAALLLRLADEAIGQPLILIVDDDEDLCQSLWDVMREHGFRVCLAHDITVAEQRVRERDYQAVLVDMKLPSGRGDTLLKRIHLECPAARTVVITGFSDEMNECVRTAVAEGADAVCYKPFDVESLLNTIRRLVTS